MKKVLIGLFVITALALSVYSYGFDLNLKKKGCEKACDTSYDECMKKVQEEQAKAKDDVKKKASELACGKAKDDCYKKCGK